MSFKNELPFRDFIMVSRFNPPATLQTGFRAMMGVKIYGFNLAEIERVGLEYSASFKNCSRGDRHRCYLNRRKA